MMTRAYGFAPILGILLLLLGCFKLDFATMILGFGFGSVGGPDNGCPSFDTAVAGGTNGNGSCPALIVLDDGGATLGASIARSFPLRFAAILCGGSADGSRRVNVGLTGELSFRTFSLGVACPSG